MRCLLKAHCVLPRWSRRFSCDDNDDDENNNSRLAPAGAACTVQLPNTRAHDTSKTNSR